MLTVECLLVSLLFQQVAGSGSCVDINKVWKWQDNPITCSDVTQPKYQRLCDKQCGGVNNTIPEECCATCATVANTMVNFDCLVLSCVSSCSFCPANKYLCPESCAKVACCDRGFTDGLTCETVLSEHATYGGICACLNENVRRGCCATCTEREAEWRSKCSCYDKNYVACQNLIGEHGIELVCTTSKTKDFCCGSCKQAGFVEVEEQEEMEVEQEEQKEEQEQKQEEKKEEQEQKQEEKKDEQEQKQEEKKEEQDQKQEEKKEEQEEKQEKKKEDECQDKISPEAKHKHTKTIWGVETVITLESCAEAKSQDLCDYLDKGLCCITCDEKKQDKPEGEKPPMEEGEQKPKAKKEGKEKKAKEDKVKPPKEEKEKKEKPEKEKKEKPEKEKKEKPEKPPKPEKEKKTEQPEKEKEEKTCEQEPDATFKINKCSREDFEGEFPCDKLSKSQELREIACCHYFNAKQRCCKICQEYDDKENAMCAGVKNPCK